MEKTISLDYLEKKWLKVPYWGYGFGLILIGLTLARSIRENGLRFWPVAFLILLALGLTVQLIISHNKRMSRVVIVEDRSISLRFSAFSRLRTFAVDEIDHFVIHPNRVDLVLRKDRDNVLTLAPYAYQEAKRLKEVLREFAVANLIQLVESSNSPSQRKGTHLDDRSTHHP